MEEVEFIPGHRFELEKLGILKPEENRIRIEDLVKRTLETGTAEQVVELIRMEHAHTHKT